MMTTVMILKVVLATAFGISGIMTLLGSRLFKQLFKEFKLNRFAMILVGLFQMTFVILLFNHTLDFYAAICLAYLTTAAIYKHIKIKHPFKKYIPAGLLLILSMTLALLLMKPV